MILEGILTTLNDDDSVNVAAMGPAVEPGFGRLRLRPFQTSTTYHNLKRRGEAVFHVTDDVELLARAAIGRLEPPPAMRPAAGVRGFVLDDVCRWFAVRVAECHDSAPRAEFVADVVDSGEGRAFWGFNRGKHAVVEAAILATRVAILPAAEISAELEKLSVLVEKTGGPQERRAMALLREHVAAGASQPAGPPQDCR